MALSWPAERDQSRHAQGRHAGAGGGAHGKVSRLRPRTYLPVPANSDLKCFLACSGESCHFRHATFVRTALVICHFLMLWSIMVDDILGLHGTGVFVRVIEPCRFCAAESTGLKGRDWMRIRREFVPLFALAAACVTAGAQRQTRLAHQSPRASWLRRGRCIISLPKMLPAIFPSISALSSPITIPTSTRRHAAIFVHDASGGVFVSVPARPILSIKPGTLVDITGVTNAGDYAAVVSSNHVRPVGQSSLPVEPAQGHSDAVAHRRTGLPVGPG